MGVKGLTSFLNDNQQSVCRSVTLESKRPSGSQVAPIPVVVDGWGIIFKLWLSSLPWQSGGEYLRFYRLTHRLIASWRSVNLEPIFIFDGSAPESKHSTLLKRLDEQLISARLFYTTSVSSRSHPSFHKGGKAILPPFASQTFIHALHDARVETVFVPAGEADGMCVSVAEERGGYIFGLDSDYLILISTAGVRNVRGYCPLDMMMWVEGEVGLGGGGGGGGHGVVNGHSGGGYGNGFSSGRGGPRANGRGGFSDRNNIGRGGNQYQQSSSNGWSVAPPRNRQSAPRSSPLLPPDEYTKPSLVLRVITPSALRSRLRLPPQMMPLFGSLLGNDHTPFIAQEHFFEPGFNMSQRVEKVARVIREVVFATNQRGGSGSSTPNGSDAGDHAVQLVRKIMAKLAWKPFLTAGVLMEVVSAVIESTVQYALPDLGNCCAEYPFCGKLTRGCEDEARIRFGFVPSQVSSKKVAPVDAEKERRTEARKRYAAAQAKGILGQATHVYLYPERVYMWSVLEDPNGPSLKAEPGAREVRARAYVLVEEALGGLSWPAGETEREAVEGTHDEPDVNGIALSAAAHDEDLAARRLLGIEMPIDQSADTAVEVAASLDSDPPDLPIPASPPRTPNRRIVEYVRHGNRHAPFGLDLPPISESSNPTSLASLSDRLSAFLEPFQSANPLTLALPPALQPLVAYVRLCVLSAAARATPSGEAKWRAAEVTAVLKGGIATLACWTREKAAVAARMGGDLKARIEEEMAYPELSSRNAQILAQLGSIMSDGMYLGQALLLLPDTPLEEGMVKSPLLGRNVKIPNTRTNGHDHHHDHDHNESHTEGKPNSDSSEKHGSRARDYATTMPTLTHLTPFVFFSGITLHMLLSGDTPPGWQWSERDEKVLQMCFAATREGLPEGTVRGWTNSTLSAGSSDSQPIDARLGASDSPVRAGSAEDIAEGRRSGKKKRSGGINRPNGQEEQRRVGSGSGRFDVLTSSLE